jgi:hypothetical protein
MNITGLATIAACAIAAACVVAGVAMLAADVWRWLHRRKPLCRDRWHGEESV